VPFEDEKFSYMVLSRTRPQPVAARVLAPPKVTKSAVMAKLCREGGVETETAARREPEAWRRFKSLRWGDGVVCE
jgi:ribosomal protein RSM22 (predicted rRNA methylase)